MYFDGFWLFECTLGVGRRCTGWLSLAVLACAYSDPALVLTLQELLPTCLFMLWRLPWPMAADEAEFPCELLFYITAAPEEFSTLFVMSLKALLTEKLLPYMFYYVEFLFMILGSDT